MIGLLIVAAIIYLFVRQFYGARADRWKARGQALVPVGRYLRADYRAIRHYKRQPVQVPDYIPEGWN